MTEQQLQRKIIRWLENEGYYVVKVVAANKKGVPDLLANVKGKFVGLEVKLPGGKVSDLQQFNIDKIKTTGGESRVVYDLEDVKLFIGEINGS